MIESMMTEAEVLSYIEGRVHSREGRLSLKRLEKDRPYAVGAADDILNTDCFLHSRICHVGLSLGEIFKRNDEFVERHWPGQHFLSLDTVFTLPSEREMLAEEDPETVPIDEIFVKGEGATAHLVCGRRAVFSEEEVDEGWDDIGSLCFA